MGDLIKPMKPGLDYDVVPIYPSGINVDCVRATAFNVMQRKNIPPLPRKVRDRLRFYKQIEVFVTDQLRMPLTPEQKASGEFTIERHGWIIDPKQLQERVFLKSESATMSRGFVDVFARPPKEVDPELKSGVWEIKCMNPYTFKKIWSIETIMEQKPYIRNQLAQEIIYQNGYDFPGGGMIYVNPGDYDMKMIPFNYMDYNVIDFADEVLGVITQAWESIVKGTIPDPAIDTRACEFCNFNAHNTKSGICYPEVINDAGVMVNYNSEANKKLVLELERCREDHEAFLDIEEHLKSEVKSDFTRVKAGESRLKRDYLIGEHVISCSRYPTRKFAVPQAVKEEHEVTPRITSSARIRKLKKG